MLFWLAFACNKSPKEVVKSTSEGHRFSQATMERLGEALDSVCRGLVVPAVDLKGCKVMGPYQGTLEGKTLSTDLPLDKALHLCAGDSKCSGVSTEWYADSPFATVQHTGGFAVDPDSYGCTFILNCTD